MGKDTVKVLGIVGSPRRGGNTDILVNEILQGAQQAGADIEKVYLSQLNINPCRACDACKNTGKCVQSDDMTFLVEKLGQNQILILGTPLYFWGPTAQFKTFIDRFYGARYQVDFKKKSAILVIPFESKNKKTARHTVGMMQDTLSYLKVEHFTTILAPGVLHRGAVRERVKLLKCARHAGWKLTQRKKNMKKVFEQFSLNNCISVGVDNCYKYCTLFRI